MSDNKFQAGDRVRVEGTVVNASPTGLVGVMFAPGAPPIFFPSGIVTLIERPKRKVKMKTATRWMNVYSDGVLGCRSFSSEEEAKNKGDARRLATVPVQICWEEEE